MQLGTGVVKWFDHDRGYGFIAQDAGEDVFVHFAVVQMEGYRTLRDGASVRFEAEQGPRGLQAVRVWPL